MNTCAVFGASFEAQLAAVLLGDTLRQQDAEPGAAFAFRGKGLPQLGRKLSADAGAIVDDFEQRFIAVSASAELELAAAGQRGGSIEGQVQDGVFQALAIAQDLDGVAQDS